MERRRYPRRDDGRDGAQHREESRPYRPRTLQSSRNSEDQESSSEEIQREESSHPRSHSPKGDSAPSGSYRPRTVSGELGRKMDESRPLREDFDDRERGDRYDDRPRRRFGDRDERSGYRPHRFDDRERGDRYDDRPRRRFGDRDDRSGYRPRRFDDRERGDRYDDRPRRRFGDRDDRSGYRPRRFDDRERGDRYDDRPRRRFGDRERGDRYDERPRRNHDRFYGSDDRNRSSRFGDRRRSAKSPEPVAPFDPTKEMRLNRYIAHCGVCSRRDADALIQAGEVTVNGDVVTTLGAKVIPAEVTVLCRGKAISAEKKVYILMNKPKDCFCTNDDPHAGKTVLDIISHVCAERVYPVGRLDRNTTGLLLLTNDGELTEQLTHPSFEKHKIYEVGLDQNLRREDMDKLLAGVETEVGTVAVDNIEYSRPDDKSYVGVEIHSGQNRIIRRLFEALGYRVERLDRVYYAGLTKKNLPRGEWRYLDDSEIQMLKLGRYR